MQNKDTSFTIGETGSITVLTEAEQKTAEVDATVAEAERVNFYLNKLDSVQNDLCDEGKNLATLDGDAINPADPSQTATVVGRRLRKDFTVLPSASVINSADLIAILQGGVSKNIARNILVPDASPTVKGIAEIATQTEVEAGTDDAKIISPKALRDAMENSLGSSGYTYLSNGLILQWGTIPLSGNSSSLNAVVTFPITFDNAVFGAFANMSDATPFAWTLVGYTGLTTSGVTFRFGDIQVISNIISETVKWYAIGN